MEAGTTRSCPNCEGTSFVDGRCERCKRPVQPDIDYFNELESLAWEVVGTAYSEYGDDLRGTAAEGTELQRVIVRLSNRLRHYHYEGDGCLDPDIDSEETRT